MTDVQHSALTTTELHEPKGAAGASINTVPIADGAGSQAWAKPAAANTTVADAGGFFAATEVEAALQELGPAIAAVDPVYGEMCIVAGSTATSIASSATPVQVVADWGTGLVDDVTFDTDHLEIDKDGVYSIECSLSFTGQTNETFRYHFYKDVGGGYIPIGTGSVSRKTSTTDVGTASLHTLASLNDGDLLALFVENVAATGNPTVTDSCYVINRLKAE